MYSVRILYPQTPGSEFNLDHYIRVHSPMGLGLLKSTFGIVPLRVEIDANPIAIGPELPAFHCASNLYFEKLADVEAFKELFARPETARILQDDFANYTTNHPVISVCEVVQIDPATHKPV